MTKIRKTKLVAAAVVVAMLLTPAMPVAAKNDIQHRIGEASTEGASDALGTAVIVTVAVVGAAAVGVVGWLIWRRHARSAPVPTTGFLPDAEAWRSPPRLFHPCRVAGRTASLCW